MPGRKGAKADPRVWQPEELNLICARWEHGEIGDIARQIGRTYPAVMAKRSELRHAAKMRQACGAFLPDNGVPYSAMIWLLVYRNG